MFKRFLLSYIFLTVGVFGVACGMAYNWWIVLAVSAAIFVIGNFFLYTFFRYIQFKLDYLDSYMKKFLEDHDKLKDETHYLAYVVEQQEKKISSTLNEKK